jgi:hypothetical protein
MEEFNGPDPRLGSFDIAKADTTKCQASNYVALSAKRF